MQVADARCRRGTTDATELDSEPERQALPEADATRALRRHRHLPHASPDSELLASEPDRRRPHSVPRRLLPELLACLALCAVAAPSAAARSFPWHQRVDDATQFLQGRAGSASFAVVDEGRRVHGFRRGIQYSSASLVKAMLLVGYLDRRDVRHRRLRAADRRLLG